MAHFIFRNKLLLLVGQIPRCSPALLVFFSTVSPAEHCRSWSNRRNHLVRTVEHQPCDILDGNSSRQILCTLLIRKSPVLIWDKLSGMQEIFECVTILRDDIRAAFLRNSKLFSVPIVNDGVAIGFYSVPFLCHFM